MAVFWFECCFVLTVWTRLNIEQSSLGGRNYRFLCCLLSHSPFIPGHILLVCHKQRSKFRIFPPELKPCTIDLTENFYLIKNYSESALLPFTFTFSNARTHARTHTALIKHIQTFSNHVFVMSPKFLNWDHYCSVTLECRQIITSCSQK